MAINKEFRIEVCGLEEALFATSQQTLSFKFEEFSGTNQLQIVYIKEIEDMFKTNSTMCEVTRYEFYVKAGNEYISYYSQLIGHFSSQYIFFKTWRSYYLDVFLRVSSDQGVPLYVPVSIEIYPQKVDQEFLQMLNHQPTLD